MATKIITVVGITGNQGASVAESFINSPGWTIRGISRDTSKPSSQAWSKRGVEMFSADLDDPASLKKAFQGSNVIFGVTDFWQQMKNPANHKKAQEAGKPVNVLAYDAEIQQGKNVVDAANETAGTLDLLVLSVLGDSKKWSGGKITWNYHFEGKWRIVEYLQDKYPELYKKTSLFQPAMFMTGLDSMMAPRKTSDDTYTLRLPVDASKKIPMYHPLHDTGPLVAALVANSPGKNLMGYSTLISMQEVVDIWASNTGKKVTFERGTVDEMDGAMPGGMGRELGEMLEYISEPGYYGGEQAVKGMGLIEPGELGVKAKLTDVREYLKGKTL